MVEDILVEVLVVPEEDGLPIVIQVVWQSVVTVLSQPLQVPSCTLKLVCAFLSLDIYFYLLLFIVAIYTYAIVPLWRDVKAAGK